MQRVGATVPLRAGLLICLGLATVAASRAAEPAYKGTASKAARDEAQRSIPYDQLTADGKRKVSAVLANVSLYRRMPTHVMRCDPELYGFMVNHPDVTVNIWDVLGITSVNLTRTGNDTFTANDGAGTKGDVQFLYRGNDVHLIYAVGSYEGTMFQKPLRGGCLMLLKSGYMREPDGHYYVTSQLDCFFCVENVGVEFLAKTFQPLVGKSADYNFTESANFVGTLSRTAESRPASMQQLAAKLDNVEPAHRDRFAAIMANVAEKAADRQTALAPKDEGVARRASAQSGGIPRK